MAKTKVAVTIDAELLREVDHWVADGAFPNRSQAVQAGLRRLRSETERRGRLLGELAKLDPREEKAMADWGDSTTVRSQVSLTGCWS